MAFYYLSIGIWTGQRNFSDIMIGYILPIAVEISFDFHRTTWVLYKKLPTNRPFPRGALKKTVLKHTLRSQAFIARMVLPASVVTTASMGCTEGLGGNRQLNSSLFMPPIDGNPFANLIFAAYLRWHRHLLANPPKIYLLCSRLEPVVGTVGFSFTFGSTTPVPVGCWKNIDSGRAIDESHSILDSQFTCRI